MLRKSGSRGQGGDSGKNSNSGSSKEGSFGKNWGKLDRSKSPQTLAEKEAASSGKAVLNATILQALQAIDEAGPGAAGGAGAVAAPAAKGAKKSAQLENPSTAKTEATATGLGPAEVLNVMWEHLELMATQYNNIVGPGPFHLKLQRETSGKSRACMSTLTHSLFLLPDVDAVRLYVLPVELNRGEYDQGPQFEPNSIVLMTKRNGRTEWHTKTGTPLTATVMNATCRSLFQSLIEQTTSFYA